MPHGYREARNQPGAYEKLEAQGEAMSEDRRQEISPDRADRGAELERQRPAEPARRHGDALAPETRPEDTPPAAQADSEEEARQ